MKAVRLGEIASSVMGQAPPGKACNKEGVGTPFVKAGEFDERYPAIREWTTQPLKHSRAGDVLICVVGATAGKINQGIDCAIGRSVAAIRPDAHRLDSSYLYHFMRLKTDQMRSKSQGLAQGVITRDMIAHIEIPLPPLDEQKRIAEILDQADELRRKRQLAINHLNQLGQGIFYEMFGDPKMNPHGFPTIELGDLIKVSSGSGLVASDQKGGDYPVYGGNGVNGWHDDFTVPAGTIVIGRVGVYCGAVHVTDRSAWVTDNALVVSLKRPVNRTYLAAALKIADLNQYAGRSAQPLVSGSRIYPIEILNPSIEKQDWYESKIHQFHGMSSKYTEALRASNSLFSALQHRAFQGEL